MTSGTFASVLISSITIDRSKRQRKAFDVSDLKQSITSIGLIHPPVVNRDLLLVAGERRLSACSELGWTSIPVQYTDELSDDKLQLIELEENIKRVDLSWQERTEAILRYHEMQQAVVGEQWTKTDTANAIGIKHVNVWRHIEVAKEIRSGNERVATAKEFSTALGIVDRKRAREKDSVLDSVNLIVSQQADAAADAIPTATVKPLLLNTSFQDWLAVKGKEKFNFIHCDFPYGVGADKHSQGAAGAYGGYADSPEIYFDLLDTFLSAQETFVADSAHLMFWFSMDYYHETVTAFEGAGWRVNRFPLIWYKSDNSGILPDPKRGPRRGYETALMASRGDRLINQAVSNIFASPNKKEIHMSEKPREVLQHFFRMFVDEFTTILDPTAGSANALWVAREMKASKILGLERDTEFYNSAMTALKEKN
jgi:ParB/RepB/Spo0J family partition protein